MKIGILTLPLHTNYGGILQAWALQTVLQRIGHDVEVFGRKKSFWTRTLLLPLKWGVRIFRKYIYHSSVPVFAESHAKRLRKQQVGKIDIFIKERIKHRFINSPRHIPSRRYDAIVVGSDQIWRKQCISDVWGTTDYLSVFLPDSKYDDTLKISYAASFGLNMWEYSPTETDAISKCLLNFFAISVRELSAVDMLKNQVNIDAQFVLDPTMLLSADDYIKELNLDLSTKQDMIVSYILDANADTRLLINKIKDAKRLNHLELNAVWENGSKPSIEQWVSGIASSSIVVTDSFHGCVFSIIFRKQLIFITNEMRGNARFDSLIKAFGIGANCVDLSRDIDFSQSFDLPSDIDDKIKALRLRSMEYIVKSLGGNVW